MYALLGIFESLTSGEVIMVLVFALIVLGPERLPGAARSLGQQMAKARKMFASMQHEMREVIDDPAMKPLRDVGEFVADPRRKLGEYARSFDADIATGTAPDASKQSGADRSDADTAGGDLASSPDDHTDSTEADWPNSPDEHANASETDSSVESCEPADGFIVADPTVPDEPEPPVSDLAENEPDAGTDRA